MSSTTSIFAIILSAVLTNNFIFSQFLGCCPFLGCSSKIDTAAGMGLAVTFVMGLASAICWLVNCLLVKLGLGFLQTIDLYLPAAAVNDLRRRLITGLKEERAALPERRSLPLLPRPEGKRYFADPALIVQVHQAEQLTQELAALHPAYVYVPVEILDSDFPRLAPFLEQGAQVAAVLPRVITDDQAEDMHAMLSRAAENGVQEALVGNMGHIFFARRAGMRVRGDFGLNVFNSFTEEVLQQAGLVSATASFELRVAQIRDLAKSIDTEMIVYGRLPCMITEQCIIRNSAGRCNCSVPNNLADRRGALFPVLPAFGHRNQIFNAHKLYLADKHEDYETAGLWGVRLMFTTETPRECVAVTQSYLGLTDYRPNGLTRGLYYRGVE